MNHNNLPVFSTVNVDNIPTDIQKRIEKNQTDLAALLTTEDNTWQALIQPLDNLGEHLSQPWSIISHLNSVVNTPELRQAHESCLPMLAEYYTHLSQNKALFNAIENLLTTQRESLNPEQIKVLENSLRDFKLAGVHLNTKQKQHYLEISQRLSKLTSEFSNNILDATYGWHYHTTDENLLAGLPDHAKEKAKQEANKKSLDGWVFTLDMPSYLAVMQYADASELRKACYQAFVTRASHEGPNAKKWDNTDIINQIMAARVELANLLGFKTYADYSLTTKMVQSAEQVITFIEQLISASKKQAENEYKELCDFAKSFDGTEHLHIWDVPYYTEKLRLNRYDLSQEDLRPYFPIEQVLAGLFSTVNKLYGISVEKVPSADVWHEDVNCFAVYDQQKELIAYVYMDLYAREHKRGGAWMDECKVRRELDDGSIQKPIAYLVCNFNPPIGDKPALLTHDDVVTLFHEFGHTLQHILTKMKYSDISGINGVAWDAVELPSQFLENWAHEKESLNLIAKHYQTGESLPDELFNRLQQAKNFQSAMQMLRQLEFSLFDFRLHLEFDKNAEDQVQTILNEVRELCSVLPIPEFNRFQNGFSHIFAGGYAAGYYSYKWAEVMAADAFSLFMEKGLFDQESSQKFLKCILETGGSEKPAVLFERFRGRAPSVDALLAQNGIKKG